MTVRCWSIAIPNFTFLDFMVHRKPESVSIKHQPITLRRRALCLLHFWLDGPQSGDEHDGDEKNLCLCQEPNMVIPHTANQLTALPMWLKLRQQVLEPGHSMELPHYCQPGWRVVQTGAGSIPLGWPFMSLDMEIFREFMQLRSISSSGRFESLVILSPSGSSSLRRPRNEGTKILSKRQDDAA